MGGHFLSDNLFALFFMVYLAIGFKYLVIKKSKKKFKNMFNILAITDNKLSSLNQCNSIINELKRISKKKIVVEYMEVYRGLLGYLPNFYNIFFFKN